MVTECGNRRGNTLLCEWVVLWIWGSATVPRSAAIILFSLGVYLGCEYLLWAWTARNLDISVWAHAILCVLAVCSEAIVSLGILDYCRSAYAMRITGVKWLRIGPIVICAYLWLGYTFTANWRWPGYTVCRSINPLTIGLVYSIHVLVNCFRKSGDKL